LFRKCIDLKPGFYVAHLDLKQTLQNLGATTRRMQRSAVSWRSCRTTCCRIRTTARAKLFHAMTLLELGRREERLRRERGARARSRGLADALQLCLPLCAARRKEEGDCDAPRRDRGGRDEFSVDGPRPRPGQPVRRPRVHSSSRIAADPPRRPPYPRARYSRASASSGTCSQAAGMARPASATW
jgi:hypothetical protein